MLSITRYLTSLILSIMLWLSNTSFAHFLLPPRDEPLAKTNEQNFVNLVCIGTYTNQSLIRSQY